MEITIIGAGHGGTAAAGALAIKGHRINLLETNKNPHADHFTMLQDTLKLQVKGMYGDQAVALNCVTTEPAEVIPSSDAILVYMVTNYHHIPAEKTAGLLKDNQMVYICPGYLGTLLFLKEMKKQGNGSNVIFAEGETLPHSSRILEPGVVNITSGNRRHPVAVYPHSRREEGAEILQKLLGDVYLDDSLLEASLHNPNLLIHTIGILMNMSRVEDPNGHFSMYRNGFSPSVWKVVKALDEEKMAVLDRVGAKRQTYFEKFMFRSFEQYQDMEEMDGFKKYADTSSPGPFSVNHRYITEDVPMGLGLLHYLGKHLGIGTPMADMLIRLASTVLEQDFFNQIRTHTDYGFEGFEEWLAFLKK